MRRRNAKRLSAEHDGADERVGAEPRSEFLIEGRAVRAATASSVECPGIVSQAEIKAYPDTLIRALSTERYAVTPELSESEGKGDCGATLHGPAREFPVPFSRA